MITPVQIPIESAPPTSVKESRYPVRAAFAVTKKVRRAVDRNRVKRLMRESYRLHKEPLLDSVIPSGKQIEMVFLFPGHPGAYTPVKDARPKLPPFTQIEGDITSFITRLSELATA
jgi:hypothetical protein